MKTKVRTTWTTPFSIALREYAYRLLAHYPQCDSSLINDLEAIADLSTDCYSVEVICNASVDDDKEFSYDENL